MIKLTRRRMINLHDPYTTSVPRFKRSTVQRQTLEQVPIVPLVPTVKTDRSGIAFSSEHWESPELLEPSSPLSLNV
jgi:hypothetical protein